MPEVTDTNPEEEFVALLAFDDEVFEMLLAFDAFEALVLLLAFDAFDELVLLLLLLAFDAFDVLVFELLLVFDAFDVLLLFDVPLLDDEVQLHTQDTPVSEQFPVVLVALFQYNVVVPFDE